MTVDLNQFRKGMRLLCGGVTVITTCDGERFAGLTATAVCSLSAEPPRLLVCINRGGASYRALCDSGIFCVNLLASDQQNIAMNFAGMTGLAVADRFSEGNWRKLHTGAPALGGALATFDCKLSSVIENGSHGIVIGDIQAIEASGDAGGEAQPLLYMEGRFLTSAPLMDEDRNLRPAC